MSGSDDDTPEDDGTVFLPPSGRNTQRPQAEGSAPDEPAAEPPQRRRPGPRLQNPSGSIRVGSVLNGIYRVERFIARGGMGEVYEGVNVDNPKDRVAIKVMLAHVAEDPKARAMFQNEGQNLTRLSHPAVARYQLSTREPKLGVSYIVTEFVPGETLRDVMGRAKPSAADLVALMRRLAQGLAAAHEADIFHRDLTPANVILPAGRLDRAKIIDFGIAKAHDQETVLDGGFAGNLPYVAPEQLGDFGNQIGPWTDVYSLALVALAFASGQPPALGGTVMEAMKRRRAGPDLSTAPAELQPLLKRMLAPDPARRIRSMDEVIRRLDELSLGGDGGPSGPSPVARALEAVRGAAGAVAGRVAALVQSERLRALPRPALIAGAAAIVLLLVVVVVLVAARGPHKAAPPPPVATPAPGDSPAEAARKAVEAAIPGTDCSWLDVRTSSSAAGGQVSLQVVGAAGDPVAVNTRLSGLAGSAVAVDTGDVQQVPASACPLLNAFRAHRETLPNSGQLLERAQPSFEKATRQSNCPPHGSYAQPVVDVDVADPSKDFTLLVLLPGGYVEQVIANRTDPGAHTPRRSVTLSKLDGDKFRFTACRAEEGLQALVMIKGQGPFDLGLKPGVMVRAPADFPQTLDTLAGQKGWTVQMSWFRIVNEVPDLPDIPSPTQTVAPVVQQEAAPVVQAAPPPPPPPPAPVEDPGEHKPCLRHGQYLGDYTMDRCIKEVFVDHCDVSDGLWGEFRLRRQGAKIQTKKGAVGFFHDKTESTCPVAPPQPSTSPSG